METENDLLRAVRSLHRALSEMTLRLDVPSAALFRTERAALVRQLDDYLIPRLAAPDAPLLAVIGGPTGAGKSTLLNSVLGAAVSPSGVLRPTTRRPVLAHHPDDAAWFADNRVLSALTRTTPDDTTQTSQVDPAGEELAPAAGSPLVLVPTTAIPAGLAIVDSPDIDSVVQANRVLARHLLDAADLWLFVITPARYADAIPWDLLHQGADRGAATAVVLDRIPATALADVRPHVAALLRDRGHTQTPVFTVPETTIADDGLLSADVAAPIRSWLTAVSRDPQMRRMVIKRTLTGTVRSVQRRARALEPALAAQQDAHAELGDVVTDEFVRARERARRATVDGSLLRGDVAAQWQGFSSTRVEPLKEALHDALHVMIAAQVGLAAREVARKWRVAWGGFTLLQRNPELSDSAAQAQEHAAHAVRDWQNELQEDVAELIGEQDLRGHHYRENEAAALVTVALLGAEVIPHDSRESSPEEPAPQENVLGEQVIDVRSNAAADNNSSVLSHSSEDKTELAVRSTIDTSGIVNTELAHTARKNLESIFGAETISVLIAAATAGLQSRIDELIISDRTRFEFALDVSRGSVSSIALDHVVRMFEEVG
ncbi:MAG: dynamin family protein [Actinomycetota bacterium]